MNQKELQQMILEGEHQTQDFKFAITDTKKIARSIAAFANTDGGRLLIGVKDNGKIAGVESDEEYYMIESAAHRHCRPSVGFKTKKWEADGKTVLEIIIERSKNRPHTAPDKDTKPTVYVRVKDQNLVANRILTEVWKREKQPSGSLLKIKYAESKLLTYLGIHGYITFSKFCGMANISPRKAEKILINLIHMKVIEMDITETQIFYKMNSKPEYPEPNQELPEDW
ncbi:AlbA family DNA-binding domain-containing protein [Carboxylicivirga marina]|uniref:AlbA family DNA-binding domain-containing protein n=1 Tax=Carboxylicivirga marina TaxID=2800988 RepID=UPI0025945384|nr:ATP-binding protein [uncultured Carboxylicivirga sp.]